MKTIRLSMVNETPPKEICPGLEKPWQALYHGESGWYLGCASHSDEETARQQHSSAVAIIKIDLEGLEV